MDIFANEFLYKMKDSQKIGTKFRIPIFINGEI